MAYRLKKRVENFEIVDGPDAGKKFVRGRSYKEVPAAYAARFDKVESAQAGAAKPAAKSKAAKKGE